MFSFVVDDVSNIMRYEVLYMFTVILYSGIIIWYVMTHQGIFISMKVNNILEQVSMFVDIVLIDVLTIIT